jgi:beta-mannosidase
MYNDSWPQSHGWTIIDYYLRKKLCFHPVRRAFAPVHIVPAIDGDVVNIYGINETTEDWTGEVRYGLFKTTKGLPVDITTTAVIPSNQSVVLGTVKMEDWEALGANYSGVFASLSKDGSQVSQNRLLSAKFWNIDWKAPKIKVFREGDKAVFSSSTFAWGVCIEIDGETEVPDNCFDLIPGIDYSIAWPEDAPLPEVIKYASELFLM